MSRSEFLWVVVLAGITASGCQQQDEVVESQSAAQVEANTTEGKSDSPAETPASKSDDPPRQARTQHTPISDDLLRLIPPQAFAAIVVRGDLTNEPAVAAILEKQEISAVLERMGLDAKLVDQAILMVTSVTYRHIDDSYENARKKEFLVDGIEWAVAMHYGKPIAKDQLLRGFLGQPKRIKEATQELYRDDGNNLIFFADEQTIVLGLGQSVFTSATAAEAPSPLRELLRSADTTGDVTLAVALDPVREHWLGRLEHNPLRKVYESLRVVPEGLKDLVLSVHLGKPTESKLVLRGSDADTTAKLEQVRVQAVAAAAGFLAGFREQLPELLADDRARMTGQSIDGLIAAFQGAKSQVDEDRITMTLREPEGFGLLDGVLRPAIEESIKYERHQREMLVLRNLSIGILNYAADNRGKLPQSIVDDKGRPLLSWRVQILHYIEAGTLWDRFHLDEPWDSEHNKQFVAAIPTLFASPDNKRPGTTTYMIPRGEGTLSAAGAPVELSDAERTTAISVVRVHPKNAVIWTKPVDYQFDPESPGAGLVSSSDEAGFDAGFTDFKARFVRADLDKFYVRDLFTLDRKQEISLDKLREGRGTFKPPPLAALFESHFYARSLENLQEIVSAIEEQSGESGSFPRSASYDANGRALLSWRVHLLEQLGHEKLYKQFHLDEPWDSTHNRRLVSQIPKVYQRPGRAVDGKTNYLLPVGPETMFPADRAVPARFQGKDHGKTIVVVEVDDAAAVDWTKPEDLSYEASRPRKSLGGNYLKGFPVAHDRFQRPFIIRDFVTDDVVRALFTRAGGEDLSSINLDRVLERRDAQIEGPLPKIVPDDEP